MLDSELVKDKIIDGLLTASPASRTVPVTHWGPCSSLFLGFTNLFGKGLPPYTDNLFLRD